MMVFQKPCKMKVISFVIPIIEKKEKLYVRIHYFNKNSIDINLIFLQISK